MIFKRSSFLGISPNKGSVVRVNLAEQIYPAILPSLSSWNCTNHVARLVPEFTQNRLFKVLLNTKLSRSLSDKFYHMDLFTWCHAFPFFSFVQTKNKPRYSIYHAEFSNYVKLHLNPLRTHKNMELLTRKFSGDKEMFSRGKRLPKRQRFHWKRLGSHIFLSLQRILMKLRKILWIQHDKLNHGG